MTHSPSVAKFTMPRVAGTVPRHRLLQRLDELFEHTSSLWLSSPGGSGKTVLAGSWLQQNQSPCLWFQMDAGDAEPASFFYYLGQAMSRAAPRFRKPMPLLTPEYQASLPVFTRRFFEEVSRRLPRSAVIVFDNCEAVDGQAEIVQVLAEGIQSLPREIRVLFISRHELPGAFARLRLTGGIATLGWSELMTSASEVEEIAVQHGRPLAEAVQLAALSGGWMAALILMLEQLHQGGGMAALEQDASQQTLFDFFSHEIFAMMPEETRDMLLRTAFLADVPVSAAVRLSGNADAGRILATLRGRNFFTERLSGRADIYRYHPLFRQFLVAQAQALLDAEDIRLLQCASALLLAEAGQPEDALELYLAAAHWEEAAHLLLEQAAGMIAQGRGRTLEGWLRRFPQGYLSNSPWLGYWLGLCRMPYDPAESRTYLEQAFAAFSARHDVSGVFLAWASIVDTFLYQWSDFSPLDRWLAAIEGFMASGVAFPSVEIEARVAAGMLNILIWRQPQHPGLPLWAERVWDIALNHPSVPLRVMLGSYLIIYYIWIGNLSQASLLIDTLRPAVGKKENDPLTQQNWHVMEAMHAWCVGDHAACMAAVGNGLGNAEHSGIHLLDLYLLGQGVYSGISLGDGPAAVSCLDRMAGIDSPRIMDRSFYQYQASTVAWIQGDLKKSAIHGRLAVQYADATGCPLSRALCLVELAVTLYADGEHAEAYRQLELGCEAGANMNLIGFMCAVHQAGFALAEGNEIRAVAALRQGLAQGARQGYVNIPRWSDPLMSTLCAVALRHGIETDYVLRLIQRRGLLPPANVQEQGDETWPWPIRVTTLGQFAVQIAGQPLDQGRKSQQKSLALLKVLAASGAAGVGAVRIAALLWPDAEGDKAHHALEMAIHRLRKLLGREDAVLLGQGQVRLNGAVCWVDAHAFAADITSHAELTVLERRVSLYRGQFLADDDAEEPWMLSTRDRLRLKFLNTVERLCDLYEASGQDDRLLELCRRGAELDELAEDIYYRYIRCCLRLGRSPEAMDAYARLERAMQAALGLRPSPRTAALLHSLGCKTG